MSGQVKAAAFKQNKNRQQSTQKRQTAISGGQQETNQSSMPFYPLDDPVFDAIKRHLTIGPRIGFEPMNQRFARIAFFFKNRMDIKLVDFLYNSDWPENSILLLVVKRNNGANECQFDVTLSDMESALHAFFLRIRKWRSVDFSFDDCTVQMQNQIASKLLYAILAKSRPEINIRRFSCRVMTEERQEKIAEFLQRDATNLRSLAIRLSFYHEQLLPVFVRSIGACHELRRLVISTTHSPVDFPPSFLPMLLDLKKLNAFVIGYFDRLEIAHHCLSINDHWLPFLAQSSFASLLKKMQCLNVNGFGNSLHGDHLVKIVTEMCSPVRVIITAYNIPAEIMWPTICNDLLPMVHMTRSNFLITGSGLPRLTAEQFVAGLSNLPAIVQTSLTLPDLESAPVRLNRYVELEFRFANGGKLTVKRGR